MSLQDKRSIVTAHSHHHTLGIPQIELEPDAGAPSRHATFIPAQEYQPLEQPQEPPWAPSAAEWWELRLALQAIHQDVIAVRAELERRTWKSWFRRTWAAIVRFYSE